MGSFRDTHRQPYSRIRIAKTNTNTDLKHEVERPGHDDGVVEGDHGGDGEQAVP